MPAILLATYVFNIFIKQFETTYISYGCLSRTVPIFRVIGVFLSAIGIIILFILNLLIIAPIRSIFIMAYALLTQAFRRTLDKIMMAIFTHLGRTPSRDSVIAKKISGPGMSKDFYMSINEEDVYVLVRSRLESIYMTQVHLLISSHLQKELNVMKNIINRILKPFGAYYNKVDYISANVQTLQTNYHNQFNGYMKRYPYNPVNVRFTQE